MKKTSSAGAKGLGKAVVPLILFVAINAIGYFFGANPTIVFIIASAFALGILFKGVKKG